MAEDPGLGRGEEKWGELFWDPSSSFGPCYHEQVMSLLPISSLSSSLELLRAGTVSHYAIVSCMGRP